MVISTEEYFQIKAPYFKEFIILLFSFVSFFSILFFSYQFYLNKTLFNLLFLLISLILFLSFQAVILLVLPFFYNLGLIIFQSLVIFGLFNLYLKNIIFASILTFIFFIFYLFYWWKIVKSYKNALKLNFLSSVLDIWNFLTFFLLIFTFLSIVFLINFKELPKESIEKFIEKSNYFFEVANLGIVPETKIRDILSKNLPAEVDEKTKEEILKMGLEELNKRLKLNLKLETTLKEALAEYIYLNFQKIETSGQLAYKIILGLFLVLILRYVLLIIGSILSVFAYLIFLTLKYLKLIQIEYQLLEKEIIKI